jgi:transmembrane sensor
MDRGPSALSERDAAAMWHERLHRDKVSEETRRDFDAWLAASPAHRHAYQSVEGAWASLRHASEAPSILALRHETALRLTRKTSGHTRPLRWAVAAAILIGLGVGTLAVYPTDRPLMSDILATIRNADHLHYQTATGERLAVSLPDGSQVTLDTQSELKLNFSPAQRRVQLTRGQAFFEVAKDPKRPFVVATRNRQFLAVGTAFDVRLDGDQVRITMVEGTVRVESTDDQMQLLQLNDSHNGKAGRAGSPNRQDRIASSGAPPIATITAGEQLISDAGREDHVLAADPDRDTSWRRGQVIFENTRLADAVAEINRYSETKIELGDASLADLRLSGAFATGRTGVFIEAVTSYFPVKIGEGDDKRVVLESRK